MPMKCMDQIPVPMENAPPRSHRRPGRPSEAEMREARSSAVYDASDATARETKTSQKLYEPLIPPPHLVGRSSPWRKSDEFRGKTGTYASVLLDEQLACRSSRGVSTGSCADARLNPPRRSTPSGLLPGSSPRSAPDRRRSPPAPAPI